MNPEKSKATTSKEYRLLASKKEFEVFRESSQKLQAGQASVKINSFISHFQELYGEDTNIPQEFIDYLKKIKKIEDIDFDKATAQEVGNIEKLAAYVRRNIKTSASGEQEMIATS